MVILFESVLVGSNKRLGRICISNFWVVESLGTGGGYLCLCPDTLVFRWVGLSGFLLFCGC